jgi:hypothetical protein
VERGTKYKFGNEHSPSEGNIEERLPKQYCGKLAEKYKRWISILVEVLRVQSISSAFSKSSCSANASMVGATISSPNKRSGGAYQEEKRDSKSWLSKLEQRYLLG